MRFNDTFSTDCFLFLPKIRFPFIPIPRDAYYPSLFSKTSKETPRGWSPTQSCSQGLRQGSGVWGPRRSEIP